MTDRTADAAAATDPIADLQANLVMVRLGADRIGELLSAPAARDALDPITADESRELLSEALTCLRDGIGWATTGDGQPSTPAEWDTGLALLHEAVDLLAIAAGTTR